MQTDADVLAQVEAAFGSVAKPLHFTNFEHCEECAEHDATLRNHDKESLGLELLDNPGWDPLCFCSPEGKAYYFSLLAKYSLAPPRYPSDWYGEQLLFHLESGGRENLFLQYCSIEQRRAVAALLSHWIQTQAHRFAVESTLVELQRAHELWSE